MKHLSVLLCVFTLASCGIKNKIWDTTSGKLGVSKQPIQQSSSINSTTKAVEKVQQLTSQSQQIIVNKSTPRKKSSELKWYYSIPFVGLVILALLVYRLKQQNLKSL